MKKRYALVALMVIASMVFSTMVSAQSGDTLPGSGWWTGTQIQNIGTSAATIVSTAYDATNPANTYTAMAGPLAAGSSVTFLPADFTNMPNGFQGSAVVSSDQPIKAIVNLTNRLVQSGATTYGIAGGLAGGQYQGVDGASAATTIRFPIAKKAFGPKTTTFFVQNAGAAADDVQLSFVCGATTYTGNTASIQPGQMVVVSMDMTTPVIPDGQLCSGTVSSGQPIAGVATEHYTTESVATLVQATRGFTSADYGTTIYAPLFKNNFPLTGGVPTVRSRTAGAQVQNVSGGAINITGTFVGSGGSCAGITYTQTFTGIASGASATFLNPTGMPNGCLASATFVGTGQIVGIVNESYLYPTVPAPGTQSATAYNMAPQSAGTNKAVAPLFKEKFGGKTSGLQIQNIGTVAATMHAEFRSGANTWTTINYNVAPGASQNFYLISDCVGCWNGTAMPPVVGNGYNTSVTIISDQPVLSIIAEQPYTTASPNCYSQSAGACYDRQNYEGFNVAP
jgi:hypothetical protein